MQYPKTDGKLSNKLASAVADPCISAINIDGLSVDTLRLRRWSWLIPSISAWAKYSRLGRGALAVLCRGLKTTMRSTLLNW